MADEAPQTQSTPTEPLGNSPTARNPDGSLVSPGTNQSSTSTNQTQESQAAQAQTSNTEKPLAAAETKAADTPQGAPEKYEAFKAPEGWEFHADRMEPVLATFKELNLSQDQAQRLVDIYGAEMVKAIEEPFNQFTEMRNGWRNELINNPELGNGKDNLKPEVLATIGRAIDSLPNAAEFREAMAVTGAGDNPAFVKAFYALAKRSGEGTQVRGGNPSPAGQTAPGSRPATAASAMYPHLAGGGR